MSMPLIQASTTPRDQAITDLIQSVALEEAALSNILNAEGDKLQTVIHSKEVTASQLLCMNKSVQAMVNAVTRLEMVLQAKLELVACDICPICQ